MRAARGLPDTSPPLVRRFAYSMLCRVIRYPGLLRFIAALLRRWPSLGGGAARIAAVKRVLTRPVRFSNTSHAANLVAGEFLIGMDAGAVYDKDKTLFEQVLGGLHVQADADAEARARASALATRLAAGSADTDFDLIEDYLFWVVYRAIEPAFGFAASVVVTGSRTRAADEAVEKRHLLEARHVAAHLFAGRAAPLEVQRRAEMSADSLSARMQAAAPEIAMAWAGVAPRARYVQIVRNAVGLAWVSHPVTVQAGALVVEELLGRRPVYDELRRRASALGPALWAATGPGSFRATLSEHVRELMRFRPVFPLLARDVPRDTEFESGAKCNQACPARSSVRAWSIGAQFDPQATPDCGNYRPGRAWSSHNIDDRDLMFGFGDRQCPAKDEAVEILTSALLGLLTLPELHWARPRGRRIVYDGPMVRHLRLRAAG